MIDNHLAPPARPLALLEQWPRLSAASNATHEIVDSLMLPLYSNARQVLRLTAHQMQQVQYNRG